MTIDPELDLCPFCGGKAIHYEYMPETACVYVDAVDCGDCGVTLQGWDKKGNADKWNARVPPSLPPVFTEDNFVTVAIKSCNETSHFSFYDMKIRHLYRALVSLGVIGTEQVQNTNSIVPIGVVRG